MTDAEFAEIVGSTKKIVLSAVSRTLPSDFYHAIDDIVQETYIRAYRSLAGGKFRNEASISTWLFTIARNESLRMLKKINREEAKRQKEKIRQMKRFADEVDIENRPDLENFIEKLPDAQKSVIELFLAGKKEKSIAELLNIAPGTVKSRLSRAKLSLKEIMKKDELYE
jgi:RNA polymerase sigma-70 factor (ECF subfamily)